MANERIKNVVLVHGAWGEGSHWRHVIERLAAKGYRVSAAQNPLESFAGDVAKTCALIDEQDGPTILVGHSYGGAVISAAGRDDKVKGLVYVAAFVPDTGESALELITRDGPLPADLFVPDSLGFLLLNRQIFSAAFCQDAAPAEQLVMNAAQKPTNPNCLQSKLDGAAAWRSKPSWYALSTQDQTVPPALQRFMATRAGARKILDVAAGHASMVTRPDEVVSLIEEAAQGAG